MNCYQFEDKITQYLDNELKQNKRKLFLEHKEKCPKCLEKFNDVKKYLLMFKRIDEINTSKHFLSKLDKKIYNFNNKTKFWNKFKKLHIFFNEPKLAVAYTLAIIVCLYSFYSIINVNNTDYNQLNDIIALELSKNKADNKPTNKKNNIPTSVNYSNYNIDDVDDLTFNSEEKDKSNNLGKLQRIKSVSNSNSNNKISNFQNTNEVIASSQKLKNFVDDEKLIKDYLLKNQYYLNRKDSLLNQLKNTDDHKSYIFIKELIKQDSLKLLKYLNDFQKR